MKGVGVRAPPGPHEREISVPTKFITPLHSTKSSQHSCFLCVSFMCALKYVLIFGGVLTICMNVSTCTCIYNQTKLLISPYVYQDMNNNKWAAFSHSLETGFFYLYTKLNPWWETTPLLRPLFGVVIKEGFLLYVDSGLECSKLSIRYKI